MKEKIIRVADTLIELSFYVVLGVPLVFLGGVEEWTKTFAHFTVFFALILYLTKAILKGKIVLLGKHFIIPITVFFASLVLSTIFSVYHYKSVSTLTLFLDSLTLFILNVSWKKRRSYFERVALVLLSFGFLHALYAIYEPLFLGTRGLGSWYINGTFYNHNHFAAYLELLIFIPVFAIYFKRDFEPWKKFLLWGFAITFAFALLLSASRGATVAVFIALICLVYFKFKGSRRAVLMSALFFCLCWSG